MISKVDDNLYRGPRPQPSDYDYIRATFKTVISLEGQAEDVKEWNKIQPVPLCSFPISTWQIYVAGITQQYLDAIVDDIECCTLKPVYLHCEHGEDRTGLVVAAYRVRVCGWTKEAAWAEAKKFGYRWYANFGLNRTWGAFKG